MNIPPAKPGLPKRGARKRMPISYPSPLRRRKRRRMEFLLTWSRPPRRRLRELRRRTLWNPPPKWPHRLTTSSAIAATNCRDAQDEAVLDLIAAEMSAPQPMDDELAVAETAMIDVDIAEAVLDMAEAVAAPEAPSAEPEAPTAAATTPPSQPTQIGEAETSIGAAVIASGILKKPAVPANDPLAPIRRMSQAERLAFFS